MTARSFVCEKVALAASAAWVGTTAAWVICSIMTFFAARFPKGRGVGSTTTGAGAGARLAVATLGEGAAAARGAEGVTVGTAALAAGCALDLAGIAGMGLTAGLREGVDATAAADLRAATTGLLAAAGLAAGREEAFATGEAVFLIGAVTFELAGALAAGFWVFVAGFTTDLAGGFAAGLAGAFDTGFAAALAAGLRTADTGALAAGERPLTPAGADLACFADLVAGAFTRGLLSVPDGA